MFSPQESQEVQLFLALLFPWDDEEKDLYKTVSWTFVGEKGDAALANYAAQTMPDLIRLIETRARRPGADVYVALGTQRVAMLDTLSKDGFPKALRQHKNIVSYKSIALDIDVKQGAYATTEDAFAALDDFCRVVGLPVPTMEVYSGSGGLHVYWCTDKSMPFANWLPLAKGLRDAAVAYGLKIDPQVTVNPAGILRVPNTYNHKSVPARKVQLYREEGHSFPRYGYQQLVGALAAYISGPAASQGAAAKTRYTSNFTDNIESAPPVLIDDIAVNCAAIDDILERGGDGDAEPLWNLALYAAAFTADPHDAAHRLSDADPRYSHDATEKKLLEKINARAANPNAGWPTCESFSVLHPACATCPLFVQKKTPFHHAHREVKATAAATLEGFVATGDDPLMPLGYWRNKQNHVFTTLYKKNGDPYTAELVNYPILDAGIDDDGNLLYLARIGGIERWREVNVSANLRPVDIAGALSRGNGLFINPKNHPYARDFFVAWISHLQTLKRAASQSGYGWNKDSFSFDDKIYYADRTETVFRGKHHDKSFSVSGSLKPWQDAMQLVYGNTPLETVVASAFAAPLVDLIGSSSLILSIYSNLSGIGKSTAMMLAQGVWGHPRSGMSTLADTYNSMMKKIADLRSLPIYWDELRTKGQLEKVIDIVFSISQGKAKARLNKDISQADAPIFTTMFVVASNCGIGDTVYSQTESTEAGGLRLFEIDPVPLKSTCSNYQANQFLIKLQTNYGAAGAVYAEWLARNRKIVVTALKTVTDDLDQRNHFQPKERFWMMTMATLLLGATLANHCGLTSFDIDALRNYLDQMLQRQRGQMKLQEYATIAATQDVLALLQEMISDQRGKGLILTETIPYGVIGRPAPNNLIDTDLSRLGDVWMQLGVKDRRIRARVRPFNKWLRERHLNPNQIITALKAHYIVTQSKQTIGSGVTGLDALARFGRSECYDFTPTGASSPSHDS
jgi:Domain of unknown function (DUF927)